MNSSLILIVTIAGGLIGLIISISDVNPEKWPKFKKVIKPIAITIIASVVSFYGTVGFYAYQNYNELNTKLDNYDLYFYYQNNFSKAYKQIDNLEQEKNLIAKSIFKSKLDEIEIELKDLEKSQIIIPKDEILNTWEKLINSSKDYVWATNLVSKEDWKYVSRDQFGLNIQKRAIDRDVVIKRINLYDESVSGHKEGLELIKNAQQKIGVEAFELPKSWLYDNPIFNGSIQRLETADLVLIDGKILLCTIIDPTNYKMKYAKLTYDKDKIDIAYNLFMKLFEEINYEEIDGKQ